MAKPNIDTLEFLFQEDVIGEMIPRIGKEQWQALYLIADDNPHRFGLWSAFLDADAVGKAMEQDSWDLQIGDGRPGFSQTWSGEREVTTYHPYGSHDGIRPLILYRQFSGAFQQYVEVVEEFRLYHDLAEDRTRGLLLSFDASGREIEVVRLTRKKVQAKIRFLRQFQAATGLYIAIYWDSIRYSEIPLENISPDKRRQTMIDNVTRWHRIVDKCDSYRCKYKTFSRVLGKTILTPPPQDKAGIWPFEEADRHPPVTFIIGVDEEGNEIEYTSDPESLSNNFGANPGAPNYLTPVFFRREVLTKYFAEPDRYKVSDGRLECLDLWSCQIDNDLKSHVVVFLGDLGRDLPYVEQLHWRQYKIEPQGQVSETNFRRSFLSQFADAQSPDLVFRSEYFTLGREWQKTQGWSLFLAPSPGDAHLLDTIRIPVTNSQLEFDEQILNLAKLLIDSLNEKELEARAGPFEKDTKGITKLEVFLDQRLFPERGSFIQLLRDVQSLRSRGAAHRKGSDYQKTVAKLGIDPNRYADAVRKLLEELVSAFRDLCQFFGGESDDVDPNGA